MRNYTYGDFFCNSVSVLYYESKLNSVCFLQQTTRRQRRENTENLKKKKKKKKKFINLMDQDWGGLLKFKFP